VSAVMTDVLGYLTGIGGIAAPSVIGATATGRRKLSSLA
jgi:hypothetical protein